MTASATGDRRLRQEGRPRARNGFARELVQVGDLIAANPNIGARYTTSNVRTAKRVLMSKTRNYVYFEGDKDQDRVVVLAVWGAPRSSGPNL